jgi:hypothetical protein
MKQRKCNGSNKQNTVFEYVAFLTVIPVIGVGNNLLSRMELKKDETFNKIFAQYFRLKAIKRDIETQNMY